MATVKTYVYFNLHKHVWSVMFRGIVVRHAKVVCIKGADFVVRPAGHARVIREQRKSVHAFVRGTDVALGEVVNTPGKAIPLSYNPYKGAHFYRKDTGQIVESAAVVELRADNTVWAWGVKNAE